MTITVQMLAFQTSILPSGMLQACVEQFYPHVDQIVIVEGATKALDPAKFDGNASGYTADGASHDGTLQALFSLPNPDGKIEVVPAQGFWNGKTAMANESARRAIGDYLWEISTDEFYRTEDILKIKALLKQCRPDVMHFYANHFVGDFEHIINSATGHLWGNDIPWQRIHRNAPGSSWISHEPPLYRHSNGFECESGVKVQAAMTAALGIRLFHYAYVARSQAEFKANFYCRPEYIQMWDDFQKDKTTKWINGSQACKYEGPHPEAIEKYFLSPSFNC